MSMPSRPRTGSGPLVSVLLIVAVVAVTIGVLAAFGVTPQALIDSFYPVHNATPATDRGVAAKQLYDIVFLLAAAIFIAVEVVIVYTVFRYRRRPGDDELPAQTHGNNLVEVIWTAIPTAIVLFLFVMSWQTLNTVEARTPSDTTIRVVASRFQFEFDYLESQDPASKVLFKQQIPLGDSGGMAVPVGRPVHVILTAKDVIHAFYVPKFLFKRDAVPGKENLFDFTVEEPGTYRGQCAELCGSGHGAMVFEVHALPQADYDAWLKAAIEKAAATPPPAPSGPTSGPVIELEAKNIAFTQTALEAPAGAPFTIHYANNDASVPHDLKISDASGAEVAKGGQITGVKDESVAVPALEPGAYTFMCTIHPAMTGTLTVK